MADERRQVFIIGLDEFQRSKLQALSGQYAIHPLLDSDAFHDRATYPVDELIARALGELRSKDRVDAVVAYMDFPASTMAPALCRELGIGGPSLESVLSCEHKYWSRLVQRRAAPQVTPEFCLVDPERAAEPPLPFPFWVKPIKSWGSFLGFRIDDRDDWSRAMERTRAGIMRIAEPFNAILRRADLSPEVAGVDGRHCIAESILPGDHQCTVEGFVVNGRVGFHGVVDSVRRSGMPCFTSYQLPSRLPGHVLDGMRSIARDVILATGLDRSGFNAEFLWDRANDRISLIEINPRVAQHHSDLFEKVVGRSNLAVAVEVAVGREPSTSHPPGRYGCAAAFFMREYEDGTVVRVPDRERISEIEARFPDTTVEILVEPGRRLSELVEQDSYSYAVAMTYVGAENHDALLRKYSEIERMLDFRFERQEGRRP